mmetsp:Transcript_45100/g.134650  ORF Transcript_45100/g.134650 Transcript_45100/m.134650 type:complete len:208 (+) Transcript_45100:348-971(+)
MGCRHEEPGHLRGHCHHHVVHPSTGGCVAQGLAPAVALYRHHRRDHHYAAAAGSCRIPGTGRGYDHQGPDVRRGLLRVRHRDPVAHCDCVLPGGWLHQVWPWQPHCIRHRERVWQDDARPHVLARHGGGAAFARHSVGRGTRWWHLLPVGQGAVPRVRLRPGEGHCQEDWLVPDADLLPDHHRVFFHVHHCHGGQPAGGEPGAGGGC